MAKKDHKASYIISASLGKGCYRHIRISAAETLERLHSAILEAFGFEDDHAHAFFLDNRMWSDADSYFSEGIEDAERQTGDYALCDVGLCPGMSFKYVFDFGDEWAFQLKLLRVLEEPTDISQVIRSVGEAPSQYGEGEGEDGELPAIFSPELLKGLYKALALPPETVELLHWYFDAFASLYGILPLRKALEIYNRQNPAIDERAFALFSSIVRHEEHRYAILGPCDLYAHAIEEDDPLDREIVEDSVLVGEDAYPEMIAAQKGKPYYIPPKAELLKYADSHYFERNPPFMALRDFLRDSMKLPADRAEDIADELQLHASMAESDMRIIMDDMGRMGLKFRGIEDVRRFMALFTEMSNNARMQINRGHAPNELRGRSGPPREIRLGPGIAEAVRCGDMNIDELRKGATQINFPNADMQISYLKELARVEREAAGERKPPASETREKVGRNDPCPCGSGKKYKKCCGQG